MGGGVALTAQSTLGPVLYLISPLILTGTILLPKGHLAVSGVMLWEGRYWHLVRGGQESCNAQNSPAQ